MLIVNEDCFNYFNNIESHSIDLILTDMPYNMTKLSWDRPIDLSNLWNEFNNLLKPKGKVVLFSSGDFTIQLINSNLNMYKYKLIWEKNVPTGMSSAKYRPMKYYEEICIFQNEVGVYNPQMKERVGNHKECYNYEHYCGQSNHVTYKKIKKKYHPDLVQPSDVLHFNVVPNRNGKLHPTQKPVDLCEWLIKTYSNAGDTVLDPFMGSGTTGIACKNTNRYFIGIEKDISYFNIAKKRLEDADS